MLRILLVDDDPTFVQIVLENLQRVRDGDALVFDVQGVMTPAEALAVAQTPGAVFDVFLIDVNLKAEMDGITLMQELQKLHLDADTIVFTGYDDDETGRRASEMGADHYFTKPVVPSDLRLKLRRLKQQRSIRRERNWLTVLMDMAEASQRATSKQQVADAIVRGGQQLGFQRARLWWVSPDNATLELAAHVGSPELDRHWPIKLPAGKSAYGQRIIASVEAVFFDGPELGLTDLEREYPDDFRTPVGDWAGMALRSGERLLALLLLDNGERPQRYSSEQRKLISVFGRQAAVAIEKAHLFELEQQKSNELDLLNRIGQQITSHAADNLDDLLLDLRGQIGGFMAVCNFMLVLKDDEIGRLEFRLQFEEDERWRRRWEPLDHGLVSQVIASNSPLDLPTGTGAYLKDHNMQRRGRKAKSWLGVPLRVADHAIGAVAVQDYRQHYAFTPDQARLLTRVAAAIAGAIQAAWIKEKQATLAARLSVLQRFGAEFASLVEENGDFFWHAVLTAATAEYGLGFNRAMLFLRRQESPNLCGAMGIGQFERRAARKSWEHDKKRGLDLAGYLTKLRSGKLKPTPVETAVKGLTLLVDIEGSGLRQALETGQRVMVTAGEAAARLPAAFVQAFGAADYAIVPLRAGKRALGVLVVDNVHNGYAFSAELLEQLETMLTQAALIHRNVRQRQIRDLIVDTNTQVVSQAAQAPLDETLQRICQAAAQVTEADIVVIYPLRTDGRYDTSAVTGVGLQVQKQLTNKPRQRGVTAHVLNRGVLVIPDVQLETVVFNNKPLPQHSFIVREQVQAFIGVRVKDAVSGEAVGALYFNYRHARPFDERDRRVVEMFAGMAATAIATYRQAASTRTDLHAARESGEASRLELLELQRVLEESLVADAAEDKLIPVVLRAAHALLDQPDARIALLLRDWIPPADQEGEPREIQRQFFLDRSGEQRGRKEANVLRGISGLALQTGEIQLVNDIEQDERGQLYYSANGLNGKAKSELDVPIRSGRRVTGVLNAESPRTGAFDEADGAMFDRLTKMAALAFDNVRRQSHLRALADAAKAMTRPTERQATLDAIIQATRSIAPDLSAVTVWYRNPEDARIWFGSHYGVKNVKAIRQRPPEADSVVARIMQRTEPLWAENALAEPALGHRFVVEEHIVSCGALPLRLDEEPIGVIFLNYRTLHDFSSEEKAIFPLLAEIAAVSLQDAMLYHRVQQEQKRLQHALDVTAAVGTTLSLPETLTRIMQELARIYPSATPCVMLHNDVDQTLDFAKPSLEFYRIDNPDYAGVSSLPLDGPGLCVQTARRSLATEESALDVYPTIHGLPNYLPLIQSTASQMNIGLLSSDRRLLGVLVLESSDENAFLEEKDTALVRGIAQQISLAIERAAESARLRFKTTVASRTSWAAELAHEANREIGYIRNRTCWISDEEHSLAEIRGYVSEIEASAKRLARAVQSDRDAMSREKQVLSLESPLKRWLREIVTDEFPGITVRCADDWAEVKVQAHPETLQRAVRHVLRNAIEAMQRQGEICCWLDSAAGDMVEIHLADTGPGIPSEIRPLLGYEPQSTKGDERGYGLLLVHSLVEDMGGNLLIPKISRTCGAEVILRLPLYVESSAEEAT